MSSTKHIDWIDLAKGVCILLVTYVHCKSDYYIRLGFGQWNLVDNIGFLFRMPLYFFLSGLFFKDYEFIIFLKKKINKLIIPFIFFLLASIVCKLIYTHFSGQQWYGIFYPFMTIWFLCSLFLINIYFYIIHKTIAIDWLKIGLCFLLGIIGFYLGKSDINEITHISTSLTALPFFVLGFWCNREKNILSREIKKVEPFYAGICLTLLIIICNIIHGEIDYRTNYYTIPVFYLYLGGIIGIIGILLISRYFYKLPIISYLGRYSIIVMITHYFYLQLIPYHIKMIIANTLGEYTTIVIFLSIVLIEIPTIWFCKKYLPYIFAQKDLIK